MSWFAKGAVVGAVGSPFLAAATALVFRFPVPFADYASGPAGLAPAFAAGIWYGLIGGFVVEALLGGLGGVLGARLSSPFNRHMRAFCYAGALMGAELGVATLAVLESIIGTW